MFEDATFESTGRIQTRSRNWMVATFVLNASIVLVLVLIPLIYPQALPRLTMSMLMEAPTPPKPQPKPQPQPQRTTAAPSQMSGATVLAPSVIPSGILIPREPEPPSHGSVAEMGDTSGLGNAPVFGGSPKVTVAPLSPTPISSGVMAGLLIQKTPPSYPPIAKAVRVEGTIVLQATISRNGTIENLRVVSGPPMLAQAALDAVKSWRYRPYLLDGVPVEVETTVNVIFKLQ